MPESVDWDRLLELRESFIGATPLESDYWARPGTLESYDATFAQRIGWKWDFVMKEVMKTGWSLPEGMPVCDWGCGSGIAGRIFLEYLKDSQNSLPDVYLWDRSAHAIAYASGQLKEKFPGIRVHSGLPDDNAFYLVSHVMTELAPDQFGALTDHLEKQAHGILWVEPGAYAPARQLSQLHQRLTSKFHAWAPCPDDGACPMMQPDRWEDWCHQFAPTPSQVFQDPFWAAFSRILGVDLRSLPVSFLCLDKASPSRDRSCSCRFLGRPRMLKYQAEIHACFQGEFRSLVASKRQNPSLYKTFKKGDFPSLANVTESGGVIDKCDGNL